MTQEEKAKAYDEALENMRKFRNALSNYEETDLWVLKKEIVKDIEYYFPELRESEDKENKKWILEYLYDGLRKSDEQFKEEFKCAIAWLEKQKSVGEIVERCKDSWYNEGKIAGMAEGLMDDEKYQQGWHDAIEKQGEQNSAWNNGYSNGYIQAIDKACEWLENHNDYIDVKDGNVTYFDMEKCVEDFKNYMRR